MRPIADMFIVLGVFLMGAVVGAPIAVFVAATLADKILPYSLESALKTIILSAFFGAIAGGTIALVILSRMTKRR